MRKVSQDHIVDSEYSQALQRRNERRDYRDWKAEQKRRSFEQVRKSGGGSKEADRRRRQMERKSGAGA